jgi:hypothetical protein
MTTTTDHQVSKALYQNAQKAIDYALRALDGAEPLAPFSMTWRDGETTIERFKYGAYDDSIELAMRAVNSQAEGVGAYAVVWAGYIDSDGQRRDAVVAEVADRQSAQSMQLAQPYRLQAEGVTAADGGLLALGEGQNLLTGKFTALNLASHLVKPAYVTTEAFVTDVKTQPYAQMPIALICLGANLCEGAEAERITLGIRKLQSLVPETSVAMTHRVLSVVTAEVAGGDLMSVLPTDDIGEMAQIVLNGAAQVHMAVHKGLVWEEHAKSYFADMKAILQAVLTNDGTEAMPEGGARLTAMLEKATGA